MKFITYIAFLLNCFLYYSCTNPDSNYEKLKFPAIGTYKSNNHNKDYIEIKDSIYYTYHSYGTDSVEVTGKFRFVNYNYDDHIVNCRIILEGFRPKFESPFGSKNLNEFECYYWINNDSYQIVIDPQINSYNFTLRK